ncbi:hypothetical protein [Blautia sp. MSJ-19]|uniref:hypothetical protein n=1 Tax=Blautia sp. MSJ-19 TaxID=2841517 RepID=UPI001C0EF989|nr:hypothetical protein [Blautia sp. MSJ-19]MBU5482483.1 hypothetical protein [Blautia sp. MSJ-19]
MAEYRRFVAYVYEYQKEKKGSNCGFVKVEVRGEVCRIELHLQCPGLLPDSECRVYGFVRNKGLLDGFLIGTCRTMENRAECILETSAENMAESEKALSEMSGMIFTTDQGGFFGTEWDDERIRPGDFRVIEKKDLPEKREETKIPEEEEEKPQTLEETGAKEEEEKQEPAEKPEEQRDQTAEEKQKMSEAEKVQELHTQSLTETQISQQESQIREEIPIPPKQHDKKMPPSGRPLPGTPCEVFADGELTDCRKISPQDLCRLGRRACMLRNNRFVQYGSYNFGHLLLCRNNCGQHVLGVPGGYDQQERFMANMFGFPYFKESRQIQIPGGRGGYWYRLIDSPDTNHRNGLM